MPLKTKKSIPWNKGKKLGFTPKKSIKTGEHLSKKTEFKKGSIPWNKGLKMSDETRKKVSESRKGKCLGIIFTDESKRKISESNKGKPRLNTRGEKNKLYKGTTPIFETIRKSLNNKIWRTSVFERDNYTCQSCGDNTGGNLEADHIIPFSIILNKLKLEFGIENLFNIAMECQLLRDINNGRTLCKPL